jgi:hypothetical protein
VGVTVATAALRVVTKAVQVRHAQQPVHSKPHALPRPQPVAQICLIWMTIFRFELRLQRPIFFAVFKIDRRKPVFLFPWWYCIFIRVWRVSPSRPFSAKQI